MCDDHKAFMQEAINLSQGFVTKQASGPFGAIVVKDGQVVGRGANQVTATNDPTAHAEIVAIREAAKNLGTFDLNGCVVYASTSPCPMCMSAIMWSRIDECYYANGSDVAAAAGFDDSVFYEELAKPASARKIQPVKMDMEDAAKAFELWVASSEKIDY